jgi:hypothetical protein
MDLSKRWQFSAMGINNPDRSPDQLLPQMIRNARDIFVQNGSTLQGAQAHGLTNFFTLDDLNRFKNMSDAEINAMESAHSATPDCCRSPISRRNSGRTLTYSWISVARASVTRLFVAWPRSPRH